MKKCHCCGGCGSYCEDRDSYFCEWCDIWLEDGCEDFNCYFRCYNRHSKPSFDRQIVKKQKELGIF